MINFAVIVIVTSVLFVAFATAVYFSIVPGNLSRRKARNARTLCVSWIFGLMLSTMMAWPHLTSHRLDAFYGALVLATLLIGTVAGLGVCILLIGALEIGNYLVPSRIESSRDPMFIQPDAAVFNQNAEK